MNAFAKKVYKGVETLLKDTLSNNYSCIIVKNVTWKIETQCMKIKKKIKTTRNTIVKTIFRWVNNVSSMGRLNFGPLYIQNQLKYLNKNWHR